MSIRLGIVITGLNIGGAERVVAGMVGVWARDTDNEIRVTVYSLLDGPLRRELEDYGCHVLIAPPTRRRIAPSTAVWLLKRFREDQIDIVHAHLPRAGVYSRLAAASLRIPVVYTEHNMWDRYSPLTRFLNRATFRWNSDVLAVSQAVADSVKLRRRPSPPVSVVPNGIASTPDNFGASARREMGLNSGQPVIGSVANLHPKKGLDILLRATKLVLQEFPDMYCVITGRDDGDGARLMALADELEITPRVKWLGCRDDARSLVRGLDVFVLSSHFEGLPIALLEAMEAGIAVVATRVGGIPEVITNGQNGILIRPGDVQSLASEVVRLLHTPEQRLQLGKAARSHIHSSFHIDRTASEHKTRYYRLMHDRGTI